MKPNTASAAAVQSHHLARRPLEFANARWVAINTARNGISVMNEKLKNVKHGLQMRSPVAASACHRRAPHLSASAWNIRPHAIATITIEISSDTALAPNTRPHAAP